MVRISVLEQVLGGSAISKSNPNGVEFEFGGSFPRERHFEVEPERFQILFWRKSWAGAAFRIRTKEIRHRAPWHVEAC